MSYQTAILTQSAHVGNKALANIYDVKYGSGGVIYVLANNCIQKYASASDFANNISTLIAGTCGAAGYAEGIGNQAFFSTPKSMVLDQTNNLLYITDSGNNRIRKVNLSTNVTSLVA